MGSQPDMGTASDIEIGVYLLTMASGITYLVEKQSAKAWALFSALMHQTPDGESTGGTAET